MLKKRRLGRMGYEASIINLGGCGVGRISQDEADEAVKLALKYGVNMIDVAPTYGEAELRLAPWVQKMRAHFFIAEKTRERSREGAWRETPREPQQVGSRELRPLPATRDRKQGGAGPSPGRGRGHGGFHRGPGDRVG